MKHLEQIRNEPFVWGKNDCLTFCANYYLAKHGKDYAEQWRGTYTTELEAYRILRKEGGTEPLLTNLGFTKLDNVAMAMRGDVVLYRGDHPEYPTAGICAGKYTIFAGNVQRLTSQCHAAYTYRNTEG